VDDAGGDGVEDESAVTVPLGGYGPAGCVGVGGGLEFAGDDAAKIIGDHVMVLDAGVLPVNAIEEFDEFDGLDGEAGLFLDFADDGLVKRFADVDEAAGDGPVAAERLCAAADEQDAAGMDDDGADADERGFREFSWHGAPRDGGITPDSGTSEHGPWGIFHSLGG
jgi:hypothetical protein